MCLTPKISYCPNGITCSLFVPTFNERNEISPSDVVYDDCVDSCSYISNDELQDFSLHNGSFSVLQLNMRGLINKQSDLNKLLHAGDINKVDVALLCETWLRKETMKLVNIPGYTVFSKEQIGKKGGGVCILVKNGLKFRHRQDLEFDGSVLENIVVELKGDKEPLLLASCYRAPNSDQLEFIAAYTALLNKLNAESKKVVIGLEHNLDLLKCNKHRNTHDFLEKNLEKHMLTCLTKPTRITHNTATLIDNVLCSEVLYHGSKNYILIDDISDHLSCLCIFENVFPTQLTTSYVFKRRLTEKNLLYINADLSNGDWSTTISGNNCNEQFNSFHDRHMCILDKHAPEKAVKTKTK